MKKLIFPIITFALLTGFYAGPALSASAPKGAGECQPIYGGGGSCEKITQIEINKTVKNPGTQVFVDNLSVSDKKYAASQVVPFKITIKNTSKTVLTNITIKDILPEFVEFAGGIGKFDARTKTLTIALDKLNPGEARDFYVEAKVVSIEKLPSDRETVCVINQSIVTVGDKKGQDNSQFCIQRQVTTPTPGQPGQPEIPGKPGVPSQPGNPSIPGNPPTTKGGIPVYPPSQVTTSPRTGPEALALIGLIPSAIGGLLLRKKA